MILFHARGTLKIILDGLTHTRNLVRLVLGHVLCHHVLEHRSRVPMYEKDVLYLIDELVA